MSFTIEQKAGLNIALNEADLLALEVDPDRRTAVITLRIITLPEEGPRPEDPQVLLTLFPVGRFAASFRKGRFDDPAAELIPFNLGEINRAINSFWHAEIYGWDFFDRPDPMRNWGDRLSLDWSSGEEGRSHTLTLFQEDDRILDLCVWFDELEVRWLDGTPLSLDEFIAGGERYWKAFRTGDLRRSSGGGVYPMRKRVPWESESDE